MKKLLQYYQIFCDLSLDVVLGVFCCMVPLPFYFNVSPPAAWYIGLPAATWIIYLSDHLLDNFRNPERITTSRHLFIAAYRNYVLVLIAMLAALVLYLSSITFSLGLLFSGSMVLMFCIVYFFITSLKIPVLQWLYNKELFVSFIYATGIYIMIGLSQSLYSTWLLYYFAFMLIVYINLLMVSIIEVPKDRQQHQFSWASVFGEARARVFFYIVVSAGAVLLAFLAYADEASRLPLVIAYAVMLMLHLVIYIFYSRLMKDEMYRKLSEIIFWLPGLLMLLK